MIIPSTNDVLFASLPDWVGSLKINDWDLHLSRYENGFFFNWDSLHARLNIHYEAWSYKKKKQKRLEATENLFRKNLQLKDVC